MIYRSTTTNEAVQQHFGPNCEIVFLSPRRKKPGLDVRGVADFRLGVDRLERVGDRVFVVSGDQSYAPLEVEPREVVGFGEFMESLQTTEPEVVARILNNFENNPEMARYLSLDGIRERIAACRVRLVEAGAIRFEIA